MKYLIPCALLFPLLSSCTVIQEDFYQPEYLGPAPRVEVTPSYPQGHYHRHYNQRYHNNNRYYSAPRGKVYYEHAKTQGHAVVVTPPSPQARVEVQNNVHGHNANNGQVHGHTHDNGNAHNHPDSSNVHGHDSSNPEEQKKIHDHG
ncbi:hypothetical protein [Legionella pneumophila]|uniref:hypothetical protein n=1 Tax=Legionella pneumophila TaxID=446 RepID=UPI000D063552|nr:hypothetical protein [Legionella pneumophila]HAU1638014.1 hypothetical protein [Legionella pneumophila]